MKSASKIKCSRGFSLIEVFVIISIIVIIAMIAIPNYLGYLPKSRLSGATRTVAGDLMATRMNAVKMNRSMWMEFQGWTIYKIAYTGTSSNVILKTVDISNEFSDVKFKTSNGALVQFNSRGAVTSGTDRTVTLSNVAGEKDINVNIAGRVKIN